MDKGFNTMMEGEVDQLTSQIDPSVINAAEQSVLHASSAQCFNSASPLSTRSSKFAEVNAAELKRLQNKNINKNTKRSTNTWVNRFEAWREASKW